MKTIKCISTILLMSCTTTTLFVAGAGRTPPTSDGSDVGRKVSRTLQFLSPLQSLTIFPQEVVETNKDSKPKTYREQFLQKFKAGYAAEMKLKERLVKEREIQDIKDASLLDSAGSSSEGWDKRKQLSEKKRLENEELRLERVFDRATSKFNSNKSSSDDHVANSSQSSSKYQFVGVIQPPSSTSTNGNKEIKWYARKRPSNSKWNVRLLHVNKEAVLRDLFVRGKIDVYAKYVNTGKLLDQVEQEQQQFGDSGATTVKNVSRRPWIQGQYSVKERSWRTLWNFHPLHLFTDSSGAFWRERRLTPGLYTDGKIVYESRYRYSDGKNGMKPISALDSFLKSKIVKEDVKKRLLKRLQKDSPDVVIEE